MMQKTKVPGHLKQYVVDQNYQKYTPVDQAVWRYVMRQNVNFLDGKGHQAYVTGLKETGINVESIPMVEEMNVCLEPHGWGAITIDGFIPGVAFFDFQARGLLPIAAEIRTKDHVDYTPAPDIIHEAAGHAPILSNSEYARYVKIFGEIGGKALATKEEHDLFAAIKQLSSVMEDTESTEEIIKQAEINFEQKRDAVKEVSEAAEIGRLYWWTVEYGLIGDLKTPLIYGAGLLSSVGESASCLKEDVSKIPFSLKACIETDYDITKPQPQLFVCQNFDELIEAVQQYSERMAYKIGGTESLQKAIKTAHTATIVYQSGLQVTGTLTDIITDDKGDSLYLKTTGPTALAINNEELPGHDKGYHSHGFSSPIGLIQGHAKPLEDWSDAELAAANLLQNEVSSLLFESGVKVEGKVNNIHRENGKVIIITFHDCTVTYQDQTLFQPEWGVYDMAVGASIVSVFAEAADPEKFYADEILEMEKKAAANVVIKKEYSELDNLYGTIREIREDNVPQAKVKRVAASVSQALDERYPNDWLLRLECLELAKDSTELADHLRNELERIKQNGENTRALIDNGLKLIK